MIFRNIADVIVLSGAYGISPNAFSKTQMLHRVIQNLNIEGFEISQVRIFEDPLVAKLNYKTDLQTVTPDKRYKPSRLKTIKNSRYEFSLNLSFNKLKSLRRGTEITYAIKQLNTSRNRRIDTVGRDFAMAIKNKIHTTLEDAGGSLFVTLPAA